MMVGTLKKASKSRSWLSSGYEPVNIAEISSSVIVSSKDLIFVMAEGRSRTVRWPDSLLAARNWIYCTLGDQSDLGKEETRRRKLLHAYFGF